MTSYEDILYSSYKQVDEEEGDNDYLIPPKRPKINYFIIRSPEQDIIGWATELASSYGFEFDLENSMLAGKVIAWPTKDSNDQILLENLMDDEIEFKVVKAWNIREVLRDIQKR
jgi:hypothetical protein